MRILLYLSIILMIFLISFNFHAKGNSTSKLFSLIKQKKWQSSYNLASKIGDPVLKKIVLPQQYLDRRHKSNSFEKISVPEYLVSNSNEHFALEVVGDSMIDEGIFNGDIVIIKKQDSAYSGNIIVALIDENEVTLKKYRSYKNSIALEPANSNFKTRIFGLERIRIQGILAGLIRKF